MKTNFLTLICPLIILSGQAEAMMGKIINERYISSSGQFSFKAPKTLDGTQINEFKPANNDYVVNFKDDWGNLMSVEVLTLNQLTNPKALFEEQILVPLVDQFPMTSRVLENESVFAPIGDSYFAVLDIPHENKTLNLKRLYLVSFLGPQAVIISSQEPPLSQLASQMTGTPLATSMKPLVEKMLEIRLSYKKEK